VRGLQALCADYDKSSWFPLEAIAKKRGAHAVIFPGAAMHMATGAFYGALLHRVMASTESARTSVVFKLKQPEGCVLDPASFARRVRDARGTAEGSDWWSLPQKVHWKCVNMNKKALSIHPFLGLDLETALTAERITYADFFKKCGEYNEETLRWGSQAKKFLFDFVSPKSGDTASERQADVKPSSEQKASATRLRSPLVDEYL
jgi:hypothetical protein